MTLLRLIRTLAWFSLRSLGVGMIVCMLSWSLVECAPGSLADRAAVASGAIAEGDLHTPPHVRAEIVAQVAKQHELDGNRFSRFTGAAANVVTFNYGRSWQDSHPVRGRVLSRAGLITLLLSLAALVVSFVLAIVSATGSARNSDSVLHRVFGVLAALALSIPIPWVAMLALDVLAYGHPFSFVPKGGMLSIGHAVVPILVLAVAPAAVLWRHLRQRMHEVSKEPWVVTARARGVVEVTLWSRQILKVALPTALALLPVLLAYLLAAAVVVERVFAIPGLGSIVASAAQVGDVPVLVAFASLSAILISLSSQCTSALTNYLDPRRGP